jgi:hypothetical protein
LKFLGIGQPETIEGPLDTLYGLARRIRIAGNETELLDIEDRIDGILREQRALAASGNEEAIDAVILNVAADRLENLVDDRRAVLGNSPATAS